MFFFFDAFFIAQDSKNTKIDVPMGTQSATVLRTHEPGQLSAFLCRFSPISYCRPSRALQRVGAQRLKGGQAVKRSGGREVRRSGGWAVGQ